eukprot:4967995-Ditylum_brightwellii.AAC.1
MVKQQMNNVIAIINAFPPSWKSIGMDGYTYDEPLETELGIMIQILRNHLDEMINQEGRNNIFKAKKSSNMPSA